MRELADALAYSLFLFPIAAGLALATLATLTGGKLGLIDLIVEGAPAVARSAPVSFTSAVVVYAFSAFVLAEIAGATRLAARARSRLVTRLKLGEGLTDEPIWWTVFEEGARDLQKKQRLKGVEVFINAHISGGGRYTGVLHHFTVAPDTESNRDFAIWKARYYAPSVGEPVLLAAEDIVILNARDCLAIEVRYVPKEDIVIMPKPASVKTTTPMVSVETGAPSQPNS